MSSKIAELTQKISLDLAADPSILTSLNYEMSSLITSAHTQDMASDDGFCFKFNLSILLKGVNNIYKILKLNTLDVFNAFKNDFGSDAMKNHMHSDPYYQILLLLVYYGIKDKDTVVLKNSHLLILFKLWNGRRAKYFKWCDKSIMKYVTTHMCTNRHLFVKYDTPLVLLRDYFSPTLLDKYKPNILSSPGSGLKRLFEQSFGRIDQLFVQSSRIDLKTGEKKAICGILPLYIKANELGSSITNPSITVSDDMNSSFSEYTTSHNRDEIINSTVDYITLTPNPVYSSRVINTINAKTKVSTTVIEKLATSLHNHRYYDHLHDIVSIILSRTDVEKKEDVCSLTYEDSIIKNIISSKNNLEIKKLNILLIKILTEIFEVNLHKDINVFSSVQQTQLKNVLIYCIVYNMKIKNCKM